WPGGEELRPLSHRPRRFELGAGDDRSGVRRFSGAEPGRPAPRVGIQSRHDRSERPRYLYCRLEALTGVHGSTREYTMLGLTLFLVFLVIAGLFTLSSAIKIIGQAEVMVIERLGRFHRVGRSGFNVLIPFIDRPRSIDVRVFDTDVNGVKRIT